MKNAKIKVAFDNGGYSLFADEPIESGETILFFEQNFVDQSTNKTLRIDEHLHQLSMDPNLPENFVNHSCDANAYIDFQALSLRASRKIEKGEEIAYNYFTTDYENEDVFDCHCGAKNCKKRITGFKSLPLKQKMEIRERLSPFLLKKLEEILASQNKRP
jgi:hypothetical protein